LNEDAMSGSDSSAKENLVGGSKAEPDPSRKQSSVASSGVVDRKAGLDLFAPFRAIATIWDQASIRSGGFLVAVVIGWTVELIYVSATSDSIHEAISRFCVLWFASGAAFFLVLSVEFSSDCHDYNCKARL
jgi:hypothetical protein